jgi:hypothetical protein
MTRYLKDAEIRKPPADVIKRRRERFDVLNELVTEAGGWILSTPGNREVVVECLPDSGLPNLLADRGHGLTPEPDGERILPVTAGIARTKRFSFNMP